LALAHLLDNLGWGRVITIDINQEGVPSIVRGHPRITLLQGDACEEFENVRTIVGSEKPVLIIEDSSHTYENTLNVLRKYCSLVTPGSYFIVEDSICHHGLEEGPSPGPYEAIAQFAAENSSFEVDRSKEAFLITWNPTGYLKRKGSS
jgi:cephalosporin hydroxylase